MDVKIEFTLKKTLNIAKNDFYELIIDIIKRKRQVIAKTIMARILDILMIKKEEEIRQVFALICNDVGSGNQSKKHGVIYNKIKNIEVEVIEEVLYDEIEDKVL